MRAILKSVDLSSHFGVSPHYGHPLDDDFDSQVCATIELHCSLEEWEAFQRAYMAEQPTPDDRQLGEGILEGELEDG